MAGLTVNIEITEEKLCELIYEYLTDTTGLSFKAEDVKILVKSKQNYRSEWEPANFKATVRYAK